MFLILAAMRQKMEREREWHGKRMVAKQKEMVEKKRSICFIMM